MCSSYEDGTKLLNERLILRLPTVEEAVASQILTTRMPRCMDKGKAE